MSDELDRMLALFTRALEAVNGGARIVDAGELLPGDVLLALVRDASDEALPTVELLLEPWSVGFATSDAVRPGLLLVVQDERDGENVLQCEPTARLLVTRAS